MTACFLLLVFGIDFEFSPFSKPLPISLLGSVPVTFNSSVVV